MHEPEIFAKNNKGTLIGTKMALDKMGYLIKWKPDHSDTILDIGCGPGNVLMEIVLPRFKGNFSKCYAIDLSDKMIEYANENYGESKEVEFLKLDIVKDVDKFLSDHGAVDHVVSSFVVHWLPDQDTGLKNIFKALKPGGDFFTVHCKDSAVFDIYKYMDENAKWNVYLDDLKQFIPSSHTSKQPEQDLRDHLQTIGFTDIQVDMVPNNMKADSVAALKVLFSSGLAQIHNIPEEKRWEYLDDVIAYALKKNLLEVNPDGHVSMSFNLFVAYAQKPE